MVPPVVSIKEGQLKGKTAKDFLGRTYFCFSGIPYAKAPVGDLRFKAPVPIEPWEGIKDATKEGPECPSRHMLFLKYVGAENNCLNLNVYTPELTSYNSNLKPVMVWIHGGGFLYGSNRSDLYGPDYLINENIVLVCINYRTGVLGFLSLEDSSLGVPGNAGMKDMVLALHWVQRNIKKFGGDPNNVTIFGESAGAVAVQYLSLSPLAKGLFHKGIAQSGCVFNSWARGCSNGLIIAKNLGLKETDERKILQYLRTLPAHKIVNGQHKTPDPVDVIKVGPFGPVVENPSTEGAFLTQEPLHIIKSGSFNDVPLIFGYTSREGILYEAVRATTPALAPLPKNLENEIFHYLKLKTGSQKSLELEKKIRNFYFGAEEVSEENIDKLYLLKTDNMFIHGIHRSISAQKQHSKSPIYLYKMTLDSSLNHFKLFSTSRYLFTYMILHYFGYLCGDGMIRNTLLWLSSRLPRRSLPGASHADDLGYLFRSFFSRKIEPGSIEEAFIKRFVKLWTNFARCGNPTPDNELGVTWKPVIKEENWLLNIGTQLTMEMDPDLERVKFWDSICDNQ